MSRVFEMMMTNLPTMNIRNPFVSLEHINLNIGADWVLSRKFYLDGLGFALDPRAASVFARTTAAGGRGLGLQWVNIGLQQLHLPEDFPCQTIDGTIGLTFPSLSVVDERLTTAGIPFEMCKEGELSYIVTRCPSGNRFEIRSPIVRSYLGPSEFITPRSLKTGKETSSEPGDKLCAKDQRDADVYLPGEISLGLGIQFVNFEVPLCSAFSIAQFYEHFFRAIVLVAQKCSDDQLAGSTQANTEVSFHPTSFTDTRESVTACRIVIGYHQYIQFTEKARSDIPFLKADSKGVSNSIVSSEGHHIALYASDFVAMYERARARGLNWDNPRFPQFSYGTLEDALKHNEFRVKDIIDPLTGEKVFELEHEIR
jgi:hypothetical protein